MQFVGKVITSVSEFYKDINPSTLSGAIDVLVVEDERTGRLSCSPFHVRFGKLHLLSPREKVVEMRVNGHPVDVHMKVGEAGETFFVLPSKTAVSAEYSTSPLLTAIPGPTEPGTIVEPLQLSGGGLRRRGSLSEGEVTATPSTNIPGSDEDHRTALSDGEVTTAKSIEAEETSTNLSSSPPKYSWVWGGLPKVKEQDTNEEKALMDSINLRDSTNSKIGDVIQDKIETEDTNTINQESMGKLNIGPETPQKLIEKDKSTNPESPLTTLEIPTLLSLGEYLNQPEFFKSQYNSFASLPLESRLMVEVYMLDENDEMNIKVDTTTASNELFSIVQSKLRKITSENISDIEEFLEMDSRILERRVIVINTTIVFSAAPALSLLMARWMFGRIISLETLYDKFPRLDGKTSSQETTSTGYAMKDDPSKTIAMAGSTVASPPLASLAETTAPKRSSWRFWSRSPPTNNHPSLNHHTTTANDTASSHPSSNVSANATTMMSDLSTNKAPNDEVYYRKSLRLPHELLTKLDLKPGVNSISFNVTTRLQGTATCTARIFRWRSDARIIVSDIDGTITKSDALGHLFTFVGKDWTQANVANLYTNIAKNGYHFVYLSSRSLGQANVTRGYLKGVEQNKFQLPDGPVIMSPDRLLAALRREVVLGIPQEFKIACLRDLQQLFSPHHQDDGQKDENENDNNMATEAATARGEGQPRQSKSNRGSLSSNGILKKIDDTTVIQRNPFFAGFGNRTNDVTAYLAIGIPPSRIFIINPSGTVSVEPLADRYASSYAQLLDLVDPIFPPLSSATTTTTTTTGGAAAASTPETESYNDFWYWRRPVSLAPLMDVRSVIDGGDGLATLAAAERGSISALVVNTSQSTIKSELEERIGGGGGREGRGEEEEEGLVPAYYI